MSLAKSKLDPDHPAFRPIEDAEQSLDRASRLTNQLLTFARGSDPIKEDVRLDKLVEETVHFDLSGSNVKPVLQGSDELWLAHVDKGQIQQVFSNLAINADQAMPQGGHLYITMENVEMAENTSLPLNPGKYIRITIRDEGMGIGAEDLARIFEPYYTTKQTGSGLGLATVYSIVEKHGGHISATSEPGQGTTFTLCLPASDALAEIESEQAAIPASSIRPDGRILIMDDEEPIRKVASEMFKTKGCQVETAVDGTDAVQKYKTALQRGSPFELVLLDLTVPGGKGGMEAISELLDLDEQVTAVVCSGYADDPVMGNYSEYGFKDVMSKPYTLHQVQRILSNFLSE